MGKIDQLKSELETAKMELEEYESTSQDVRDCIQRYKDIIEHKDKEIRAFQRDINRFKDLLRQTGKRLDNSEAEKNELMGILQVEREHFIHEKEKIKEDAEKRIKQIESDNQIARYLQKSEESDRVRYSQKSEESDRVRYSQKSEESDRVRYSQKSEESDRVRYSQKTEEPKTICQMYQRGYCARGEYCPDIHSYRSSPQTGQEAKDSKPYQEYQGGARHKIWKNTNSPTRSDISNHSNKDQDKKEKMITHEIEVPKGKAGLIVGKGGKTVQRIQRNSLAEIESPEYGKNTFKLHGTVKQIRQAIDEMHEVLKNPGIDDQGMKDQECGICTVPVDKVGLVIGKQGHKILNIQDVTNTVIIAPAMGKEDFKIFGNMSNIKKAKELILQSIEIFHVQMSSLLQQAKSETVSKLPTTLDESMPRPRYQSQIESLPTSLGMSPDAGLDRFNRNANRDENRDERVAKIVSAVLKEMEKKVTKYRERTSVNQEVPENYLNIKESDTPCQSNLKPTKYSQKLLKKSQITKDKRLEPNCKTNQESDNKPKTGKNTKKKGKKDKMKILYTNARGITRKMNSLNGIIVQTDPDIVAICETKLNTDKNVIVNGYKWIGRPREQKEGGE